LWIVPQATLRKVISVYGGKWIAWATDSLLYCPWRVCW
jgi:hypothetical protein